MYVKMHAYTHTRMYTHAYTHTHTQGVPKKCIHSCQLLIYLLSLFQVQITLNNVKCFLKVNVIFFNVTH